MRKHILIGLMLCMGLTAFGQSQTQARKWFAAGEYEKAKPVFAKLVKGNPKSGSMNYWYGVCLNETGEHAKALPYLKKAVDSDVENAYRYIGDYYAADGEYELAMENYEIYLDKVDPADERFVQYTQKLDRITHELKYLKRVEKIIIVDSVVMAKESFLSAYNIGHESGSISTAQQVIAESKSTEGTAYRTEMGDKIYYSDIDEDGKLQLYMRYKMLDDWSKPSPLNGMPSGDNNYPFILSDGMTIYFANNSLEGLGGYDIYITRFNTSTDRYLLPENLGMPFNSTGNDYMMAIDEINGLGWFATDRNLPDSLVCIYTFVPNEKKVYYDYESDNKLDIINAAHIYSIAATQTDSKAVRQAEHALFMLSLQTPKEDKSTTFTFVINDFTDYHHIDDFKSPEARQLYIDWQNKVKSLNQLTLQLEERRTQYTRATKSERESMTEELLRMEQQHEQLETEVSGMEMKIRNTEINYRN